jgi:hypothetical protein
MTGSAQLISAVTLHDWSRARTGRVDERRGGPAPARATTLVHRLVERVARAHERGLTLSGPAPDTVLVTDAGGIRSVLPPRPGTAAERAADLFGLGAVIFLLTTGVDPDLPRTGYGPADRERVRTRFTELTAGDPGAAWLAPVVLGLLHPEPARRPSAAAVLGLLSGRPGTALPSRPRPVTATR